MAKIRKLLSLLLCLVMVLSFFPAAYAEGENEGTITEEHDCGHDHEHEEETQGTIAPVEEEPEEELSDGMISILIPDGSYVEGSNVNSVFIPDRPLAESRYAVTNTKNATGSNIVKEARKWANAGAVYWSGIDPWIKSIAWRTGYTTDGQTSFDCSGFVGRVLNDVGFRGTSYTPSYGSGHVLDQNYGSGYIGISIEELVNYGTDINAEVAKAKNGDYSGLQVGDIIGWTSGSLGRHVIIYAGLNSNGKPSMVEFTGSGYDDREITASYQNAFQYGARFTSTPSTYLDKCTYYPSYMSGKTTESTWLKKYPCSSDTDSSSTNVVSSSLPVGTQVLVTGLYKNTANNYWYKVKLTSGGYSGKEGYIYCPHLSCTLKEDTVKYSGKALPGSMIVGKTYNVDWTVSSTYLDITEAEGYIYGGTGYSDRKYYGHVTDLSTRSYNLSGTAIDNSLLYNKLSAGRYKTEIWVYTLNNYSLDGKTKLNSRIGYTPISFEFDEVAEGTHIHDMGTYLWTWTAHPHYKCYRCSVCGEEWANKNEPTYWVTCDSCRPEKPSFSSLEGTHYENQPVVFLWDATQNTTHYNIWVYRETSSGEYEAVDHSFYVNSGYELSLEAGQYRALLQAYDSEHWESDNSDWVHTESDLTPFVVEHSSFTITYDANGGAGAPANQIKTYDVDLALSTTIPTRTGYTFLGWATSKTATAAQYQPGASYTENADLTLYAVWKPFEYQISFDANGGAGAPGVQTKYYGSPLTLSPTRPTRPCHVFLGWATSSTAATAQYQPGGQFTTDADTVLYAVWKEGAQSEWSTTKPSGVDDSLIETKTQYRYADKETTTSDQSTLSGWTLYDTKSSWSDWGAWSDWSINETTASDSTQVETKTMYRYYYFLCPNCGAHEPFWGTSDCGAQIPEGAWHIKWFTTPYSQSNYKSFSYTTAKYYTTSLGDGQLWIFSAGNLNSTAVGTKDSDSSEIVIKTGYRYRTRTLNYTYYFYRWGAWSDWGDTVYTASDSRQVETRTLYRYVQSGDVHQWDSGKVTTAATCTTKGVMTYTCSKCGKTRTAEIAAIGHNWGTPSYTWSSDYKTVTAKRSCQNNSSHVETETANTSSQVTTEATCTNKGKTTYTATFSNSAFAKQTKTVENIAALGHNWSEWKVTTPATVDKDGVETRTCSSCGATETRSYAADTVTITYNANGGSVSPTSVKILKNGSISSLPTPTYTGRNFNGWFTAASGGTQVTTSTTFSADTTIYAHWTMITYSVSYNANGGTGAPAAQTKTYDAALKLSDTKPTRPNVSAGSYTVTLDANGGSVSTNKLTAARTTSYTFKNWNTAANGSGTAYNPGASYTANADATLYAQWNSSTSTAEVTLPTPIREGYFFKGWAESSTAAAGLAGDYTPTGDVTLYAVWERSFIGDIALLDVTGHPGSEILVPVRLSSNPGLYYINFHVNFDSTVLQLTGVEDGSLTGWTFSSKSSYVHWETSDDADQTASGVIVKLRFQVKEDAADGGTTLSIDDLEAMNRDEEEILYSMVSGQVTISSRIAGDVNGDGQVNLLDLVRLRKYLMHDTSDINSRNADVTGDGKVGSADLVRMRKYLAGDPTAILE